MKKLLFLTYYFPPNLAVGGRRIENFVSAVKKTGNQARVLTIGVDDGCSPDYVDFVPRDHKSHHGWKEKYQLARRDNKKLSALFARINYALHKFLEQRRVDRSFIKAAETIIRRHGIDIVITSGPPFVLNRVGVKLKKKLRIKWIADFRDPWVYPEELYKTNFPIPSKREKALYFQTLELADHITAATMSQAAYLESQFQYASVNKGGAQGRRAGERYARKKTFCHLPNGVDLSLFDRAVSSQYQFSDGTNIGYLGDLDYNHRDPRNILRAVKQLNSTSSSKIHIHFWCDLTSDPTWDNTSLPDFVAELGLKEYVHINSYVPFEESLDIQRNLDLLIIFAFGQPLQIPAKTYEYLLSGSHILGFCESDSETFRLLNSHEGVILIDDNSVTKIAAALQEIIERSNKKVSRSGTHALSPEQDMVDYFEKLLKA
jgi:hypothetical protein